MKYTQIPANTFKEIQLNAGILVDEFDPETGVIGNLLGATTGGVQFKDDVEYSDFGDDIDNCPKNTMELKKLDSHSVGLSGTFVTISAATAKKLISVADVDSEDETHIVPRNDVLMGDFETLWWIGDYSDENQGDSAGFVAIKLFNALNTGGFQIQSGDKAKGQFAFEFTGHYSIATQDVVPYEIYVRAGEEPTPPGPTPPVVEPSITITEESMGQPMSESNPYVFEQGETHKINVTTVPEDATITWVSSDTAKATVDEEGVITTTYSSTLGSFTVTGTITYDGVDYSDIFYGSVIRG